MYKTSVLNVDAFLLTIQGLYRTTYYESIYSVFKYIKCIIGIFG